MHDIYPVAGSIAGGGLRLDRTFSSHTYTTLSHSWWMEGRNGINFSADLYVVHFPDGRIAGFHSAADSGIPGETAAWRSGFGTKERILFYNPNGTGAYTSGTADLNLEDGTVVHFNRYTDLIEPPTGSSYLYDVFTATGVSDLQGLLTTYTREQIPGQYEAWDTRLKTVTDPSGQSLTYIYNTAGGLTQITASDGQWVQYGPSFGYPETSATYSDGTSAAYTYVTATTRDPDTGEEGGVLALATAQDVRADGPMQSIQYSYKDYVPPKFGGQVSSEQHYPDGIPVSTFTSDDGRTTATDTRGDGPSRTFYMSKSGNTPLMRWKSDFDGINEYFYYDGYNYLNKFTDRRGANTLYDNEPILGRPTTITHPAAFDGLYGTSTEVYTYSFKGVVSTSDPYFVASIKMIAATPHFTTATLSTG